MATVEFRYSIKAGEVEEEPGVFKNVTEAVKMEEVTPDGVAAQLRQLLTRSDVDSIVVNANVKPVK